MSKTLLKRSALAVAVAATSTVSLAGKMDIQHLSTFKETRGICENVVFPDGEPVASCAEIAAYSAETNRIYATNAVENGIRVLDASDVVGDGSDGLQSYKFIDLSEFGGGPNSVAVHGDIVAVAVQAHNKQDKGSVELFDLDGKHIRSIRVGALPDMVTFTPDGRYILVANEGEPNSEYTVDPEGSVSVINTKTWTVRTARFSRFSNSGKGVTPNLDPNVRIFGPGASVAQDIEPEYIAVSSDSKTAWVSLQENNAFAVIDIDGARVTDVVALGFKDHLLSENALDVSNDDGAINIDTWPIKGLYLPDSIASYEVDGETFILSANEGDSRDYKGYSEEARVKDLGDDGLPPICADFEVPAGIDDIDDLQSKKNLGRLKITTSMGLDSENNCYSELYSYGGRSFSIWNAAGEQVWDSGNEFATFLSSTFEVDGGVFDRTGEFNGQASWKDANEDNLFATDGTEGWEYNFDDRSDDKGAEPESVTVATLNDRKYAFIGLERMGGIFVYDVTDVTGPEPKATMVTYLDNSKVDVSPEGLQFISKGDDKGWLMVTSEISNTVSLYEVTVSED